MKEETEQISWGEVKDKLHDKLGCEAASKLYPRSGTPNPHGTHQIMAGVTVLASGDTWPAAVESLCKRPHEDILFEIKLTIALEARLLSMLGAR